MKFRNYSNQKLILFNSGKAISGAPNLGASSINCDNLEGPADISLQFYHSTSTENLSRCELRRIPFLAIIVFGSPPPSLMSSCLHFLGQSGWSMINGKKAPDGIFFDLKPPLPETSKEILEKGLVTFTGLWLTSVARWHMRFLLRRISWRRHDRASEFCRTHLL